MGKYIEVLHQEIPKMICKIQGQENSSKSLSMKISWCVIAQKIPYSLLNQLIKSPLTYLKLADDDKPAYIQLSPFPIVLYSRRAYNHFYINNSRNFASLFRFTELSMSMSRFLSYSFISFLDPTIVDESG